MALETIAAWAQSFPFLNEITDGPIDRKKAFGRIAFAVPYETQAEINQLMNDNKQTILTPLITLATPGKATVRVIILSDPNDLEICFVDEEGFSQLSQVDPEGDAELDKYLKRDPFQTYGDTENLWLLLLNSIWIVIILCC